MVQTMMQAFCLAVSAESRSAEGMCSLFLRSSRLPLTVSRMIAVARTR